MTASPGREVDANLLRGAALGSAQPRPDAQDAGSQNLGDLVEALGGGHEVGVEGIGHADSKGRAQLLGSICLIPSSAWTSLSRSKSADPSPRGTRPAKEAINIPT